MRIKFFRIPKGASVADVDPLGIDPGANDLPTNRFPHIDMPFSRSSRSAQVTGLIAKSLGKFRKNLVPDFKGVKPDARPNGRKELAD